MTFLLEALVTFISVQVIAGSIVLDCPLGWETFSTWCYQFRYFPTRTYENADSACQINGATLLNIGDLNEHKFIVTHLKTVFPGPNQWFTDGVADPLFPGKFIWASSGKRIENTDQYWIDDTEKNKHGSKIVYTSKGEKVGWGLLSEFQSASYICKIVKSEAYRIVQLSRDFSFGSNVSDPNDIKKGPIIIIESPNLVILESYERPYLDCVATGNPTVKYEWYKIKENRIKTGRDVNEGATKLTIQTSTRYTMTNGRLTISNPNAKIDAGYYQCMAENKFGKVVGNPIQLSFGMLGEFSNVNPEAVHVKAYEFGMIVCSTISYRPAVTYQWVKGDGQNFIRTTKQQYMFISANGRLYFSEVSPDDRGNYRCLVTLAGTVESEMKTQQPPSRVSRFIPLIVEYAPPKVSWGPEIQNDFIAVYPSPPMLGRRVRLECFAQGSNSESNPMVYSWEKVDGFMADNVKFSDLSRVVTIEKASFQNEGVYRCIVKRGRSSRAEKEYTLQLSAKPYFVFPLKAQHIDVGSHLTWRCEARGRPEVTYSWYKNGQFINPKKDNVEIYRNSLIINSASADMHNGMYQCAATNSHGTTFSSAQLRVLNFKPTFWKSSSTSRNFIGSTGGNVSLICRPEGAPYPEISWSKDDQELRLSKGGDGTGKFQMLGNGNLFIQALSQNDAGNYRCIAKNSEGAASISIGLKVTSRLLITHKPVNTDVTVNETAFLSCRVSHDNFAELTEYWTFNGYYINIQHSSHFALAETYGEPEGLYIRNAQATHAGLYTCIAKTTVEKVSASAYLTVKGPPYRPSGVFALLNTITSTSLELIWSPANDGGSPVRYYIVEGSHTLDKTWNVLEDSIPLSKTQQLENGFRTTKVSNLIPDTLYSFRVRAINSYGVGEASLPSAGYKLFPSAPLRPPYNVGGGGGKVGQLLITWEKIPRAEQGASGFGYVVYWRLKEKKNGNWNVNILHKDVDRKYILVGENRFYTPYEVKVQPFNRLGSGPNSTISEVYSAEGMPIGVPTDVYVDTFNGTAVIVKWTEVSNIRPVMKGVVQGYQVNYFNREHINPSVYFQAYFGQMSEALLIGLDPNGYYWVTVQVFNTAGLGPISENFLGKTGSDPPILYPTEVNIYSHGPDSVRVTFRGIGYRNNEDPIQGYKVCHWKITEVMDYSKCLTLGVVSSGIITNLQRGFLYKLRVCAWTGAGDGRLSELSYFTLGGSVSFDPQQFEILATGSHVTGRLLCVIVCLFAFYNIKI